MAQLPNSVRWRKPATTSIHEKPSQWKEKLIGFGSWLLLIFALGILIFGTHAVWQRMTKTVIAHVNITGVDLQTQAYLQAHLKSQTEGSYFSTDLAEIRDQALTLSWVDRVVVVRQWPDTINVQITPRHAVARWGSGRLLSDDGIVFTPIVQKNTEHLPLLHGPVSQTHTMMLKYRDINQMFVPMGAQLTELSLTERMTWSMKFDNGLRIIVDQDQTMSKLQRLHSLSYAELKDVWSNIVAIDLRYRNGLAIQWKQAIAPQISNGKFLPIIKDQTPVVDVEIKKSP